MGIPLTSIVFLENFFKNVVEKQGCYEDLRLWRTSCMPLPCDGGREGPMQGLKIESKTHKYSADYHIAKEEGQNPDEDEDKKRTCVGMGEKVTLTLTGKKALIGEDEDIRWSLADGRIWAALRE